MGVNERWKWSAVPALLMLGMAGCVSVPDMQWSTTKGPEIVEGKETGLLIIEVNEKGEYFDKDQFARMKDWLAKDDAPVVLFVHGWHHNAKRDDENLLEFKDLLQKVQAKTDSPIKGIYVGWRGDQSDPVIPLPQALGDFLTFNARKNASVVVGRNKLKEIVDHLASFGDSRNVVLIGHSLGGSALYYAAEDVVAQPLNDHMEVILLNPAVGVRELKNGKLGPALAPALSGEQRVQALRSAESAPSPAFAPKAADTIAATKALLAHSNRRFLVLQASGDWAVRLAFPFSGNGKGIGFEEKLITHDSCAGELSNCSVKVYEEPLRSPRIGDLEISEDSCVYLLAQRKFFIKVRQANPTCVEVNNKSFWFVAGHRSVSGGHNDIMNDVQTQALSSLIAFRLTEQTMP